MVLPHDLKECPLELVVGEGISSSSTFRVSGSRPELADDARRLATAEPHQPRDADDVAVLRIVEILRLVLQPLDRFEVGRRGELGVVLLMSA